jgi:hypothetical protein
MDELRGRFRRGRIRWRRFLGLWFVQTVNLRAQAIGTLLAFDL